MEAKAQHTRRSFGLLFRISLGYMFEDELLHFLLDLLVCRAAHDKLQLRTKRRIHVLALPADQDLELFVAYFHGVCSTSACAICAVDSFANSVAILMPSRTRSGSSRSITLV